MISPGARVRGCPPSTSPTAMRVEDRTFTLATSCLCLPDCQEMPHLLERVLCKSMMHVQRKEEGAGANSEVVVERSSTRQFLSVNPRFPQYLYAIPSAYTLTF